MVLTEGDRASHCEPLQEFRILSILWRIDKLAWEPAKARQKAAWKVAPSRWLALGPISILSRRSLVIRTSLLCTRFAAHSVNACHDTLQHRVVADCKVIKPHVDVGGADAGLNGSNFEPVVR